MSRERHIRPLWSVVFSTVLLSGCGDGGLSLGFPQSVATDEARSEDSEARTAAPDASLPDNPSPAPTVRTTDHDPADPGDWDPAEDKGKGKGKGDFDKDEFGKGNFDKGDFEKKGDFDKGDFDKGDWDKKADWPKDSPNQKPRDDQDKPDHWPPQVDGEWQQHTPAKQEPSRQEPPRQEPPRQEPPGQEPPGQEPLRQQEPPRQQQPDHHFDGDPLREQGATESRNQTSTRERALQIHRAAIERIVELTNIYRQKNGLRPLKMNRRLMHAAQVYAERMPAEGFFDHTAPDGSGPGQRLSIFGYRWSIAGENIASGYKTAEETVRAWIKSPGHRANLLNPSYTEIGVGYYPMRSQRTGQLYPYWVQEFGSGPRQSQAVPSDQLQFGR